MHIDKEDITLPHDVVLLHCTYNRNKPCPRTSVKIARRFWFWKPGRKPRSSRTDEEQGAGRSGTHRRGNSGVTCYSRCRNAASVLQLQYFHPWNRNLAWRPRPPRQGATLLISGMQVQSCRKKICRKKSQSSCYRSLCCDSTSRTSYWDTLMLNALLRVYWDSMDWKWTAQTIKEILLTGLALLTCTCTKTSLS